MNESADELTARLIEQCEEMMERVKMLRDYATTPGSVWLARSELARINQLAAETEQLLSAIQRATD
jgi:hypothetical protein